MSDTPQNTPPPQTPDSLGEARMMAIICYALFIATFTNGLTAIIGVVLAYIKRADARGTIWESHFTNLIRVFWIGIVVLLLFLVALMAGFIGFFRAVQVDTFPGVVWLVPVFWICGVIYFVWYLFRTVKGLIYAIDGKPYP
jgi:uncharacterized membrane protein